MITKAALILIRKNNKQNELMFVRAKNKDFYVFPGGKQESNESINQALKREINEELNANIKCIKKIGEVTGQTPDGRDLKMHLFSAKLIGEPIENSEIEEIIWMNRKEIMNRLDRMTPMTMQHVLPFLEEKRIF
ncbi:MAG: NUDIX domain-containing protein [Candidatus Saccharimonadaceae bacterium]|nr:NUDIX domain-containing protein [Candidatus Saccharimonadaceae bacterium]